MNLERLRWGEWIAGIAALDLLLVTFRAWYKVSGGNGKVSAWDALSNGRYVLLATAVVGVFLLVLVAAEQAEQLSFPPGALAALVGLGCTVYIAYRLATPPADTLDADIGLYFGLASALGVAIGGLISAREAAAPAFVGRDDSSRPAATFTGPTGASEAPLGALVPDTAGSGTWSPAPATPAPNWTPAPPAPSATAAGAAFGTAAPTGERPLQVGDDVALTAGGARFPAGTIARIVEVFGGGALVEVTAADGVPERFEVPEEAFERLGAAGAPAAAGESWSPAMPAPADGAAAPAGDDWGFGEEAAAGDGAATAVDEPLSAEPAAEKVPFWKREIGGKKKREAAAAEAGAATALAAAPIAEAADGAPREERPGLFKRMFGGGKQAEDGAAEAATETSDGPAPEPAADTDETPSIVDESASAPEPEVVVDSEPEPEPPAPEPVGIVEPEPEPEPPAPEPEVIVEPEPEPPAPEPEVVIDSAPDPEPEEKPKRTRSSGSRKVPKAAIADAEPPAPEPDVVPEPEPEPEPEVVPDPEPEVMTDPEPEVVPDPEPEVVPDPKPEVMTDPEPEVVPDPEPEVVPDPEPEVVPDPEPVAAAEEEPKPRKRSSGSRKVPKEALAAPAGQDVPPVVGDQVQLKVGGGKYDAGTRGVVVDVFSAGVIVELVADDGRTERLDLPFEAVGPAEA